jgi:hypothetical protein
MNVENEIVKAVKRAAVLKESRRSINRELRRTEAAIQALLSMLPKKDRPVGLPGEKKRGKTTPTSGSTIRGTGRQGKGKTGKRGVR